MLVKQLRKDMNKLAEVLDEMGITEMARHLCATYMAPQMPKSFIMAGCNYLPRARGISGSTCPPTKDALDELDAQHAN